jgi:hypothetical protein
MPDFSMQAHKKRTLFIILGTTLLTASLPGIWNYREWRTIGEENALENLEIDSIEIKDATFDEALRVVTDKVRALGHPEFQLHIYENGRGLPFFHERLKEFGFKPPPLINLKVTHDSTGAILVCPMSQVRGARVTLHDVLWQIGFWSQRPCALRGHDLIAAHTAGTLQRYRQETVRLSPSVWADYSDEVMASIVRDTDLDAYEGTTIHFRREKGDIEFVGPDDEYEKLAHDFRASSHWSETKIAVQNWWTRMLFRLGF